MARDLQTYYDTHPTCLAVAISFPAEIQSVATDPYGDLLQALQSHRLISSVTSRRPGLLIPSLRFEITAEGHKYIRANVDKFMGGSQICYAYRKILAVKSFSPSGSEMAQAKSLRVAYTYDLKDIGTWVSAPDILHTAMFETRENLSVPKTVTETLVLNGAHWAP